MEQISNQNASATHLSKNGVWNLRELDLQKNYKDKGLVLQIVQAKLFAVENGDQKDKHKKVRAKYTLSDGLVSIIAIV